MDTEHRYTAGQFPKKLQRYVEDCDSFVCFLAGPTLQRPWVNHEIELAHRLHKPMIPVKQESFSEPEELKKLEVHVQELLTFEDVKLLDKQNRFVDEALQKVADLIRQYGPCR